MNRKITDFIRLEDGNIGRKAAVVTGALLASTVLGAVLTSEAQAAYPMHCNVHGNTWVGDWKLCHSHDHGDYVCYQTCICDFNTHENWCGFPP